MITIKDTSFSNVGTAIDIVSGENVSIENALRGISITNSNGVNLRDIHLQNVLNGVITNSSSNVTIAGLYGKNVAKLITTTAGLSTKNISTSLDYNLIPKFTYFLEERIKTMIASEANHYF